MPPPRALALGMITPDRSRFSPHGVLCKRRGRCQIPVRTSTHLPAQIVRSAGLQTTFRPPQPSGCLHSRSLAAPNTSKHRLGIRHSVGRPHPPPYTSPFMSLTHMQSAHSRSKMIAYSPLHRGGCLHNSHGPQHIVVHRWPWHTHFLRSALRT